MAQAIKDYSAFLKDAEDAILDLTAFAKQEETLKQEESRLERVLETEKKAVADVISMTVRRRREEINSSYDDEIGKIQDKLKKARNKREKAKNQGVKERIEEETAELHAYNRELNVRMKTLFQKENVPGFCSSAFYYSLYFPRGIKELFTLLLTAAICFILAPYGIYLRLPVKKTLYLVGIYFLCILVFGGLYTLIGNETRGKHLEALREGRKIRSLIVTNRRKIGVITSSIKKDKDEAVYNLEKYDDEIAQLEQDLSETTSKKKEALNTFETVTKTIISDEITGNSREKLELLEAEYEESVKRLRQTGTKLKEKKIYITDTYESYVGKEFLHVGKLKELRKILEDGAAENISEAIEVYKERSRA